MSYIEDFINSPFIQNFGIEGSVIGEKITTDWMGSASMKDSPISSTACFILQQLFLTTMENANNEKFDGKQVLMPILFHLTRSAIPFLKYKFNATEIGFSESPVYYTAEKITYVVNFAVGVAVYLPLFAMGSPYMAIYGISYFAFREVCDNTKLLPVKLQRTIKIIVRIADCILIVFRVQSKLLICMLLTQNVYHIYNQQMEEFRKLPDHITDLSAQAKDLPDLIGMQQDLVNLEKSLLNPQGNSIIVSEGIGQGKTTLVEGLAKKIASGDCHPNLKNKKIYMFNLDGLLASENSGIYMKRVDFLLKLAGKDNNIIFIKDIDRHFYSGYEYSSLAIKLKLAITTKKINIIGTATHKSYNYSILLDEALERSFATVKIEQRKPRDVLKIVTEKAQALSEKHGVQFDEGVIEMAISNCSNTNSRILAPLDLLEKAVISLKYDLESKQRNSSFKIGYKIKENEDHLPIVTKKQLIQLNQQSLGRVPALSLYS